MLGIYLEKGEDYNIINDMVVSVVSLEAQRRKEVTATTIRKCQLENYKKIDSNTYLDKRSGEIREYKKKSIKSEKSIKRSMRQLELTLRNNFSGEDDEYFITLTTKNEVKDINEIKKYVNNFIRNLKRHFGKDIMYASVFELQTNRESWHIHMLLKKIEKLSNVDVERYWKNGITKTTKLTTKQIDTVINEEKRLKEQAGLFELKSEKNINKTISYITKCETKSNLPSNCRAYVLSRNLKKPQKEKVKYEEFKKECKLEGISKKDEHTILIKSCDTDKILNRVKKEKWY